MKKIFIRIAAAVAALVAAAGCANEIPPVVEEISLSRCLVPTNVTAVVSQGEYVTFSCDKSKGADQFVVELYSSEKMEESSLMETLTIAKEEIPYTAHLVADEVYYFRMKAVSADGSLEPSKWYVHAKAIQTSAIKSDLAPEFVDRTANSISIKWTADPEVDHIRVTPKLKASDDEYTRIEVSAADAAAGAKVVEGLSPATTYTLTVHFKSADRGSVQARTLPQIGKAVAVQDTASFKAAIADGATAISLKYADTTYHVGTINLSHDLTIIGELSEDGAYPTVAGAFKVSDGTSNIYLENVSFDGLNSKYSRLIDLAAAVSNLQSVSVINCNLTGLVGLYYDNVSTSAVGSLTFDGVKAVDMGNGGGDCIDIRSEVNYGALTVQNCTFSNGIRDFMRIDKATLPSITVANNTFNNVSATGTNNGFFYVRAKVGDVQGSSSSLNTVAPEFKVSGNIFLNENGGAKNCLVRQASYTFPTLSGNYFYNCAAADFFVQYLDANKAPTVTTILSSDPCKDSEGGIFNVVNEEVLAARAGDPRWLSEYVETVEDLTQGVTVAVKTWDFSNGKLFYKAASKDMVRDGIRFYVKNNPVTFTAGGLKFEAAATVSAGVPSDCGIGIKVSEPGSIVLSTASAGVESAALVVGVEGKAKAAAVVGAQNQMITFADIVSGQETMIYIYPTSPIVLSSLQWNNELGTVVDTQLATPQNVVATPAEVTQGEDVVITWDAVEKAGSYTVNVAGKDNSVTATTFTVKTAVMAAGEQTVTVTAVPASNDLIRTASEAASVKFTVKEKPAEPETGAGVSGKIVFDEKGVVANTAFGASLEMAAGSLKMAVANGAGKFAIDANTAYFGTAESYTKFTTRLKSGAKSTDTHKITLTVDKGKGKLLIYARTGSGSATDRNIVLSKSGAELLNKILLDADAITTSIEGADAKVYPVYSVDVTAGDYELTFPVNSVNFYGFEFVAEAAEEELTPGKVVFDEKGVVANTAFGESLEMTAGSLKMAVANGAGKFAIDANTAYFGTAESYTKFTTRLKSGAKSTDTHKITLTVDKGKGKLLIYARTGSGSATDRNIVLSKSGAELLNKILLDADAITTSIEGADAKVYPVYSVDVTAGDYELTFPVGSVNFYGFELTK